MTSLDVVLLEFVRTRLYFSFEFCRIRLQGRTILFEIVRIGFHFLFETRPIRQLQVRLLKRSSRTSQRFDLGLHLRQKRLDVGQIFVGQILFGQIFVGWGLARRLAAAAR